MDELFLQIEKASNHIATNYSLDVKYFFIIYLISFFPFYLGYLLMIYGTSREIRFKDLFRFNIKNKLHWSAHVTIGLCVHIFGRIMPYVYILLYGKNLPFLLYVLVYGMVVVPIIIFLYKIKPGRKSSLPQGVEIIRKDQILNNEEIEMLWKIYNTIFEPLNRISPCKQSFGHEHFIEAMHDTSVRKYILYKKDFGYFGVGLITNDFKNLTWISEDYFKYKFTNEYQKKTIYYLIGIAIEDQFRGNNLSIKLIEYIIDDMPRDVVIGFDHSININPMLHYFTRVIRQSRIIKRTHIDKQHYHVVQYKK